MKVFVGGGFKANPAPAVAEADGAPAFMLTVGESLGPAGCSWGALLRALLLRVVAHCGVLR